MHQHQDHSKNLHPKFETVITHAYVVNKTPNFVFVFPKPTVVICVNLIHDVFVELISYLQPLFARVQIRRLITFQHYNT